MQSQGLRLPQFPFSGCAQLRFTFCVHIVYGPRGQGGACKQQQQLQQQPSQSEHFAVIPPTPHPLPLPASRSATTTISRPAWSSVSGHRNACINYYLPVVCHLLPNAVATFLLHFPLGRVHQCRYSICQTIEAGKCK